MHDLLALSMLAAAGLLIGCWVVILTLKRYEFSIFLIILSPWLSAIFIPNSFTGIAWCFGKHDRPWVSRPVFGSIRYMNDSGLKRKFDIDKYVEAVKRL